METYKSEKQMINAPVSAVYHTLTHFSTLAGNMRDKIDALPDNVKSQLEQVTVDDEGLSLNSPMGAVRLALDASQCVDGSRVVYAATQSPVKFSLQVDMRGVDDATTEAEAQLNVDLPFFLRGMVGGALRDGAAKMGQVLAGLPYSAPASEDSALA